jgi:NTE family protein
VIGADRASVDAFGANPLSPATRAPSARAGRGVGAAHAAAVAALWG